MIVCVRLGDNNASYGIVHLINRCHELFIGGTIVSRYGVEKNGYCRICNEQGTTELHHIISQERCKKIGKPEWINNPGNIVELCVNCHSLTTASLIAMNDVVVKAMGEDEWEYERKRWTKAGYVPVSELKIECKEIIDVDEDGNQITEEIEYFEQSWNRINSQRAILFNDSVNTKGEPY